MDVRNNIVLREQATRVTHSIARSEAHAPLVASNLPPDVLLHIFILFRDINSHNSRLLESSDGQLWDWLTVTRVCKHWRDVALEYPGLWSDIRYFTNLDKIRTFLERSKGAEIRLTFRLSSSAAGAIFSLFEGHMWRVRELNVTVMAGPGCWDCIKLRLAELTERTKVVNLQHERLRRSHDGAGMLDDVPDSFPGVKLRSLTLGSVALPWSCSLYHGLSQLKLLDKKGSISKPSIRELKEILEHCPGLRQLVLLGVYPTPNVVDTDSSKKSVSKIHLPLLEYVSLSYIPFSNCASLFAVLDVREYSRFYISITDYPFHAPLPLPSVLLSGRKECENLSIEVSHSEITIYSNYAFDSDDNSTSTIISLIIPASTHPESAMASIAFLLSHQYWKTAKTATVTMAPHSSMAVILDALPNITERLEIILTPTYRRRSEIDGPLHCLSSVLTNLNPEGKVKMPELEQLIIRRLDLSDDHEAEEYQTFLHVMEERTKHESAKKFLKICFLECKGISSEQEEITLTPAGKDRFLDRLR